MKKPLRNPNYRSIGKSQELLDKEKITFDSALREEGIDKLFVARKFRDLLGAQKQRWNPKTRSWEKFEDNRTQVLALRELARILDIYPRKDSEGEDSVTRINISAIPMRRDPVEKATNTRSEQPRGDGRERSEHWDASE
jgi:hypothetical protein